MIPKGVIRYDPASFPRPFRRQSHSQARSSGAQASAAAGTPGPHEPGASSTEAARTAAGPAILSGG
jgi:hypothetical protein